MQRNLSQLLMVSVRGIAMGAADVVPGVSGGTIAFITGIYEELVNSIKSVNPSLLKTFKTSGIPGVWKAVNGNFLIALLSGIGISVFSLAGLITYLIDTYPVQIWSFFFGLILASIYSVIKKVTRWNIPVALGLVVGTGIAYLVTSLTPAETPEALWFIFLSAVIAICAMILPGISGSFLLLIMGKYTFILDAVKSFDLKILVVFGLGCVTGLLSFSHVLAWMFKHYHNLAVATLTGFMIGSIHIIWPWKNVTLWRTNSHGEEVPLIYEKVMPASFIGEPALMSAIALMVSGVVLILAIEYISNKKEVKA